MCEPRRHAENLGIEQGFSRGSQETPFPRTFLYKCRWFAFHVSFGGQEPNDARSTQQVSACKDSHACIPKRNQFDHTMRLRHPRSNSSSELSKVRPSIWMVTQRNVGCQLAGDVCDFDTSNCSQLRAGGTCQAWHLVVWLFLKPRLQRGARAYHNLSTFGAC